MMNLIVTCARHLEGDTEDELIDILDELGDSDVKITVSSMSGIITVETKLDPIEVVRKMKEMLLDEPWSIRYCLRVIPVQKVVETSIDEIEKMISSIKNQIEEKESYRILIEKRNSDISSKFILNLSHLKKILSISINADKNNILLSNKIETDILMRFAITLQISNAISSAGMKPATNFILIAIGNKNSFRSLYSEFSSLCVNLFFKNHDLFIKKHFNISKKHIDTIYSKTPLEDILVEKAAILI